VFASETMRLRWSDVSASEIDKSATRSGRFVAARSRTDEEIGRVATPFRNKLLSTEKPQESKRSARSLPCGDCLISPNEGDRALKSPIQKTGSEAALVRRIDLSICCQSAADDCGQRYAKASKKSVDCPGKRHWRT